MLRYLLDVIKNCWVKTKILSPPQAEDLRTGVRRNNRIAQDESSGLPSDIADLLSDMLKRIGLKIGLPNSPPVCMATVGELLDMPIERVVEAPPEVEVIQVVENEDDDDEGEGVNDFDCDIEVDDIEPLPPLSLSEARDYATRLLEFVTINHEHIKRAGSSSNRDYSRDIDVLNQVLMNVKETSTTRQSNLLSWIMHHASASSGLE